MKLFVSLQGTCTVDSATRSSSNRAEAALAVRLVAAATQAGVQPGQIGVVCFYRWVYYT